MHGKKRGKEVIKEERNAVRAFDSKTSHTLKMMCAPNLAKAHGGAFFLGIQLGWDQSLLRTKRIFLTGRLRHFFS